VRTHALDPLADLLGIGVDHPDVLGRAMGIIAEEGRGVVCLFREPQPKLMRDEEEGPRTVKNTGLGAQILSELGLHDLVLLTNSPATRYVGLDAYGLTITGTRPITE
jgi:3,4-dihydroxy 2-butanone 4-phosphate synthase/GTP cyclohydrolase II